MKPATHSRRSFGDTKLLTVEGHTISHRKVSDLESFLRHGDLLIVNAASTVPGSLRGKIVRSQEPIEIRLAAFIGETSRELARWSAISFGAGDWRLPTEKRGVAPLLIAGDSVEISPTLSLRVLSVDVESPRLLKIELSSKSLVRDLYLEGRPIQYSYHEEDLSVWDQQTLFHGPAVSVEPPSAAFPLTWNLVLKLQKRGVKVAQVIHSAGISSTGDPTLDLKLPLAEYYEVPDSTLRQIEQTRGAGHRVVALGTSVTRAVESALANGHSSGLTSLKLGPSTDVRGIDILITGMHEEGTSHAELMKAFCGCEILKLAEDEANQHGYRSHEFGDLTLLDCRT